MTNHAIKFMLTDTNNEDMEGFNDVWANILNDEILKGKFNWLIELDNELKIAPAKSETANKISINLESNILETSQMS